MIMGDRRSITSKHKSTFSSDSAMLLFFLGGGGGGGFDQYENKKTPFAVFKHQTTIGDDANAKT